MLTGDETVAETFTATAHRCHAAPVLAPAGSRGGAGTWAALAAQVRLVTLGWTAEGDRSGGEVVLDPAACLRERMVTLLVAAASGAVAALAPAGDGDVQRLDLDALAEAGAPVDERHPDRFESLLARRSAHEPLLQRGELVHTSSTLLVAARSLAQALRLAAESRLAVELPPDSVAAVVAGVVVPCLTGASTGACPADPAAVQVVPAGTAPVVAGSSRSERRRPRRRRPGPPAAVQVLDARAAPWSATAIGAASALALDAAGGIVTGFGPPGTLGRPLPGTSVAIDDDGELVVRSGGVPPAAPALRDDGWLGTGVRAHLVGGAVVLDPVVGATP